MDWQDYENQIFEHLQTEFPDYDIAFDQRIMGRYSGVDRQIDILLSGDFLKHQIRGVVDCKCFSKKVDVRTVDQFVGFVADTGAQIGILITNMGFTPAAQERAKKDPQTIYLEIIPFETLDDWQFDQMSLTVPILINGLSRVKHDIPLYDALPDELLRYFDQLAPRFKGYLDDLSIKQRLIVDLLCKKPYHHSIESLAVDFKSSKPALAHLLKKMVAVGDVLITEQNYSVSDPKLVIWHIIRYQRNKQDVFISLQRYLIWLIEHRGYKSSPQLVGNTWLASPR